MLELISLCAAAASLLGNILIMLKKRSGWIVWIVGNLLWIAYNYMGQWNWPMVAMYIIYFIINLMGFIKWSRHKD